MADALFLQAVALDNRRLYWRAVQLSTPSGSALRNAIVEVSRTEKASSCSPHYGGGEIHRDPERGTAARLATRKPWSGDRDAPTARPLSECREPLLPLHPHFFPGFLQSLMRPCCCCLPVSLIHLSPHPSSLSEALLTFVDS